MKRKQKAVINTPRLKINGLCKKRVKICELLLFIKRGQNYLKSLIFMLFKHYNLKRITFLPLGLLFVFLFSSFHVPKIGKGIKIVVIDAGHGGKDPGCNGATHNEKEVTLAIALKLGKLIEEKLKDVKVIYTRTTDVFVELEERAQIANRNNADLFISIHCNAAAKYVTYKDKKGKTQYKTWKDKKGKIAS